MFCPTCGNELVTIRVIAEIGRTQIFDAKCKNAKEPHAFTVEFDQDQVTEISFVEVAEDESDAT